MENSSLVPNRISDKLEKLKLRLRDQFKSVTTPTLGKNRKLKPKIFVKAELQLQQNFKQIFVLENLKLMVGTIT